MISFTKRIQACNAAHYQSVDFIGITPFAPTSLLPSSGISVLTVDASSFNFGK